MEYYILNIKRGHENGHGFNAVDKWISDVGIAPIFFGKSSIKSIIRDHNPQNAYLFCSESFKESWKQSVIVSLGETDLYLYSPLESVKEYKEEFPDPKDNIKGCKVCIMKKFAIKEVPLILSTIKSNAYLGRGTFKRIPRERGGCFGGNICAIKHLLNDKPVRVDCFVDYLFCLSSLEFETLIAKLLEEKGFFVPAYHGGFLRDLDLVARNYSKKPISFMGMNIESQGSISFQVKLNMQHIEPHVDFSISLNNRLGDQHIGIEELERWIRSSVLAKKWLQLCLSWVDYAL